MAGKTVVVTGANGFIASWLVKLLLERGYTVRGTVRSPGWLASLDFAARDLRIWIRLSAVFESILQLQIAISTHGREWRRVSDVGCRRMSRTVRRT